jgi:hypothetical protein
MALMKRQAAQGLHYPTDHNWSAAIFYYKTAVRLVVGAPVLAVAVAGGLIAVSKRAWWPIAMLALAPIFFVWSLHSGGAVLTLPEAGPWSYYNSRYGIAMLPLAVFAAGGLIPLLPSRGQAAGAVVLALVVSASLWSGPAVCWREAAENSEVRRAWTGPAAEYLSQHYRPGSGVVFTFGSGLAEVLRRAGIPLREGLHEGNGPAWEAAITQPEKFLHEEWALAIPGDPVEAVLVRAESRGIHYQLQQQISVKGMPMVGIYHRESLASPLH